MQGTAPEAQSELRQTRTERFPTAPLRDTRLGALAAFVMAGLALLTFAVAAATPPRSGPFCRSGCLSYPYDEVASRVPRDFLWMYLAVLLSLAFVVFLVAVHRSAPAATHSFTLLGLALGCIAAAVLVVDYFVQLAVVQPSLLAGEAEGLALLSQYNPHGMFVALEEIGYLLMSASLLCLAPALRTAQRPGHVAAWVCSAGFALALLALGAVSVSFGLQREYRFEVYIIAIDYTVLVIVGALVGSLFRRAARRAAGFGVTARRQVTPTADPGLVVRTCPAMTPIDDVRRQLADAGDPRKAVGLGRYFQTGPGGYGEGDAFLGVPVPAQRKIAGRHWRALPLAQVRELLASGWHEERLTALFILVHKFQSGSQDEQQAIVELLLDNTDRINNWDLVDASAPYILGPWLLDRYKRVLERLAASERVWERRIAVMATFAFIRAGRFDWTFALAERLLDDDHDLVHKAVGWMLREVGNRDRAAEERFLARHYRVMPRVMLRYAIEKFPPERRQLYLSRTTA